MIDKTIVDTAAGAVFGAMDKVFKPKPKPADSDVKVRDKDLEIELELEQEMQRQRQGEIYQGQEGLEILEDSEDLEKEVKKGKKIVGVGNKEVIGGFTENLVKETIENMKGMDLDILQEKGLHQAELEKRDRASQGKGQSREIVRER